jgi:hypothetical protein
MLKNHCHGDRTPRRVVQRALGNFLTQRDIYKIGKKLADNHAKSLKADQRDTAN